MVVQPSEKLRKWCEDHYGEDIEMPLDLQREQAMICWRGLPNRFAKVTVEGKEQLFDCIRDLKNIIANFTRNKEGYITGLQPFANKEDKQSFKRAQKEYPLAFAKE